MKTIALKSMMFGVMLISQRIQSQNQFKYYLEGSLSSGLQNTMPVVGGCGAFGFYINPSTSLDFRGSELYIPKSKSVGGVISVCYNYHFNKKIFAGGGFAHEHHISQDHFISKTGHAMMGTHRSITHRSGVALQFGYNFGSITKTGFFSRIFPVSNITASYFFDQNSNPFLQINAGIRIGLQKN